MLDVSDQVKEDAQRSIKLEWGTMDRWNGVYMEITNEDCNTGGDLCQ